MWSSPFKAILKVRETKSIGTLNPIPFGITVMNCIGWVLYGTLRQDYFIFFSNIFGLLLGLFYSFSCIAALSIANTEKDLHLRTILEVLLIGSVAVWAIFGMIVGISLPEEYTEKGIVAIGILGCGCGLAYYTSFLSTMAVIIKTKDSSSLYLPTLVTNLSNSSLWVIYGFAVQDPVIWSPNFLGATLTILQLSLYFIYYPRHKVLSSGSKEEDHGGEYMLQNIQQSDEENISNPLQDGRPVHPLPAASAV